MAIAIGGGISTGGGGGGTTDASNLTTGTLADARLSANVTLEGNTFNNVNKLLKLDSNAKVPLANLSDGIMWQLLYGGVWNATTHVATLTDDAKLKLGTTDTNWPLNSSASSHRGLYYITQTAGTFLTVDYVVGDWIVAAGATWQKIDNTDAVATVFGRLGNVVAAAGDYTATQITNTPSGGISATTVQAAINELDTEKITASSTNTLTNKTFSGSTNVLGGVTVTMGSDATGDIYYRNSTGILTRLPVGSNGQVLTLAGGLPSWATPSAALTLLSALATTSGQSITSTSYTNIAGLVITFPSAGTYKISLQIFSITSTSAGAYLRFQSTGTSTISVTGQNYPVLIQDHELVSTGNNTWYTLTASTQHAAPTGSNDLFTRLASGHSSVVGLASGASANTWNSFFIEYYVVVTGAGTYQIQASVAAAGTATLNPSSTMSRILAIKVA